MGKLKYSILVIFVATITSMISCNKSEDLDVVKKETKEKSLMDDPSYGDLISIGRVVVSEIDQYRSIEKDSRSLMTFYKTNGEKGLSIQFKRVKDDLYGIDVDCDKNNDFYIRLIDEKTGLYLDKYMNPLQKVCIEKQNELIGVKVLEVYNNDELRGWFGGSESIDSCFRRRMSSSAGLLMTGFSGFIGPEGPVCVMAGAGLSCLIYRF